MRTEQTMQERICRLDEDTTLLFYARAMQDVDTIQTSKIFRSEAELRSHIDTISKSRLLFTEIKKAIGTQDGTCRRKAIKLKNMWGHINALFMNHKKTVRIPKDKESMWGVAELFGFGNVDDFMIAAMSKHYKIESEDWASKDAQDYVARVFQFKDWREMSKYDDAKYLVSEAVLQRALGIYDTKNALKETSLNYIMQYVCNMNWKEYDTPKGREEAKAMVLGKLIKPLKTTSINEMHQTSHALTTPLPNLKEGDKVRLEHADGSTDTFVYIGGHLKPIAELQELCA